MPNVLATSRVGRRGLHPAWHSHVLACTPLPPMAPVIACAEGSQALRPREWMPAIIASQRGWFAEHKQR
jgi:hypothetical protein